MALPSGFTGHLSGLGWNPLRRAVRRAERADGMRQRPVTVHLAVAARGRGLALADRFGFEEGGPAIDENTGEGELEQVGRVPWPA